MKKLIYLLTLICFSYTQSCYSQEINIPDDIKRLLEKFQSENKESGITRYCLQIYTGNDRDKAKQIKYSFMKEYPEVEHVITKRISPNWKVRAGQFETKLEALHLKNNINQKKFPGSFIIEIKILHNID